jgi:hypothetical protein
MIADEEQATATADFFDMLRMRLDAQDCGVRRNPA